MERIQRTYAIPTTRDAFLAALASAEFVRRRSEAVGLGTKVVTHDVGPESVRIVTAGEVPLDWLPGAITSRLSQAPTVERHEEWVRHGDGARSPLTFAFAGLPVTCAGEARLSPVGSGSGDGCRLDIELAVRVDVPLVGGLVERAVGPQVGRALDAEAAFYRASVGLPPSDG